MAIYSYTSTSHSFVIEEKQGTFQNLKFKLYPTDIAGLLMTIYKEKDPKKFISDRDTLAIPEEILNCFSNMYLKIVPIEKGDSFAYLYKFSSTKEFDRSEDFYFVLDKNKSCCFEFRVRLEHLWVLAHLTCPASFFKSYTPNIKVLDSQYNVDLFIKTEGPPIYLSR